MGELLSGLLLGTLGGGLLLFIVVALVQAWRRRRWLRLIADERCQVCEARFGDSMVEVIGRPSAALRARLPEDRRAQAAMVVLCHECGSLTFCTRHGAAFHGLVQVERDG